MFRGRPDSPAAISGEKSPEMVVGELAGCSSPLLGGRVSGNSSGPVGVVRLGAGADGVARLGGFGPWSCDPERPSAGEKEIEIKKEKEKEKEREKGLDPVPPLGGGVCFLIQTKASKYCVQKGVAIANFRISFLL